MLDDVVVSKPFSKQNRWVGWTYSTQRKATYPRVSCGGFAVVCGSRVPGVSQWPFVCGGPKPTVAPGPRRYHTKPQLVWEMIGEVWFRKARRMVAYLPKYGTLCLVVTKNRHGNVGVLASNDLASDLTTLVLRKRSRWSIETLFRDVKQFCGLAACQCRVDQALVRHVALVLVAFVVLQRLRLHPKETLGEVKARLQHELFTGGMPPPPPLRGKVPAAQLLTA